MDAQAPTLEPCQLARKPRPEPPGYCTTPCGTLDTTYSQLDDFDASTKDKRVQARDKDTGLPLWVVEVLDFDPSARERTFKVKIAAAVQPVPPEAVAGAPVRPVILENLTITPWLKGEDGPRPKIAYSLRCTGLAAPGRAGRQSSAA